MNLKRYVGLGTLAAIAIGSYLGCASCRTEPAQKPVTQTVPSTPLTTQPTTQPASQPATQPVKAEEKPKDGLVQIVEETPTAPTAPTEPKTMYIEICNREEQPDLYAQLQNAVENGVTEEVLDQSFKRSGFRVTNYKGNQNVVLNKEGIPQAILDTDAEGIVGISDPIRFCGDPKNPEEWTFETEPRSSLAYGLAKIDGKPIDLSDKAYAICFNNNPIFFRDIDKDDNYELDGVFVDTDKNGNFETYVLFDEWVLKRDNEFGFRGPVRLNEYKPQKEPAKPKPIGDFEAKGYKLSPPIFHPSIFQ